MVGKVDSMYIVPEFARNRKEVMVELTGRYMTECIEHLLKLALYPLSINKNYWRQEVYTCFNKMPKLESTKRYPTYQFIYETIWNTYGDDLDKYIDIVLKEEQNETIRTDDFDIYEAVHSYIKYLSEQLSFKGVLDRQETYNKLEELGL